MEVTKNAAALELKISRRTVQRYAERYPAINGKSGKVKLDALWSAIVQHKKRDGRGFPMGGKRPAAQLNQKAARDLLNPPRFHKTVSQKIEIIERELRSLTQARKKFILQQLMQPRQGLPPAVEPDLFHAAWFDQLG